MTALSDVSLTIGKGETVAVVGENGAGKTTLVRHINGLLKPTKGEVVVDGVDTRETTTATLSRKVGIAFQNPDHQLFSESVENEVRFAHEELRVRRGARREETRLGTELLRARAVPEVVPPRAERRREEEAHPRVHPRLGPGSRRPRRADRGSGLPAEGEARADIQDAPIDRQDHHHRLARRGVPLADSAPPRRDVGRQGRRRRGHLQDNGRPRPPRGGEGHAASAAQALLEG